MKRKLALLLMLTLCLTWVKAPETTAATVHDTVITFPDANLKKALIDKGVDLNNDGQITIGEMESKSKLELQRSEIQNLEGIQYAVNLTTLILSSNPIEDIKPLSELHNLETLDLDITIISDIS